MRQEKHNRYRKKDEFVPVRNDAGIDLWLDINFKQALCMRGVTTFQTYISVTFAGIPHIDSHTLHNACELNFQVQCFHKISMNTQVYP